MTGFNPPKPARNVRVAATDPERAAIPEILGIGNCSLEPLKEVIDALGADLGIATAIAPFDQWQQVLLGIEPVPADTKTLAILVAPDAWLKGRPLSAGQAYDDARETGATTRFLPNGTEVFELHAYETDYLYEEIFDRRDYRPDWIDLPPDATVIDVGANIGMFSLFILDQAPDARVYAFEPSPITSRIATANLAGRGRATLFPCGLDSSTGSKAFVHYAGATVFSGFEAQADVDQRALTAAIGNQLRHSGGEAVLELAGEFADGRLESISAEVPTLSLSDFIVREGIERIDLLKIDAERSEAAILRGLRDEHWPIVRQMIVETHDNDGSSSDWIRQTLAERGFVVRDGSDEMLSGSGLSLLYATRGDSPAIRRADESEPWYVPGSLEARTGEFVEALHWFRGRSPLPVHVLLAPTIGAAGSSRHMEPALRRFGEAIRATAATLADVVVTDAAEIERRYAFRAEAADATAQDAGILFGDPFYAAAGATILRRHAARHRRPHKVVAVDADNTLWEGVCAEDAEGLRIGPQHAALQRRLLEMKAAGFLLTIVSKNIADDVWRVFDTRDDLIVARADFAASEIGWAPKSNGISALAHQLNVGTDSFILIDDNPIECAEVSSSLPGVLALQFPQEADDALRFVDHVWALDIVPSADAAVDRTEGARMEIVRRTERERSASLSQFVRTLDVRVTVRRAQLEDLARLSELSRRVNQFASVPDPQSEADLACRIEQGDRLFAIAVTDRYGDYGTVGFVTATCDDAGYTVDQFLLSCRALGRGVEQAMLAAVLRDAREGGFGSISLRWQRTPRNQPLQQFLGRIAPLNGADGSLGLGTDECMIATLADLDRWIEQADRLAEADVRVFSADRSPIDRRMRDADWLQRRADTTATAQAISALIHPDAVSEHGFKGATPVEQDVVAAWQAALGRTVPGRDATFFDLGGTSLKLVKVVGNLCQRGYRLLTMAEAYAAITVAQMAEAIGTPVAKAIAPSQPAADAERDLSPSEMAMWYDHLRDPDSAEFVTTIPILIDSPPSQAALAAAWKSVCERHPLLRAKFRLAGRQSTVAIGDAETALWEARVTEWTLAKAQAHIRGLASRPMDLTQRAASASLVTLGDGRAILILQLHHIIIDLESIGIIVDGLSRCLRGDTPPREGTDYAAWIAMAGYALASNTGFRAEGADPWWQVFDDAASLPADKPPLASWHDDNLGGRVKRHAAAIGVSPAAVVLAAIDAVARRGGAGLESVASPVNFRVGPGLEHTVGNFVALRRIELGAIPSDLRRSAEATQVAIRRAVTAQVGGGRSETTVSFAWHDEYADQPITDIFDASGRSQPFDFGNGSARILGHPPQTGIAPLSLDAFVRGDALMVTVKGRTRRLTPQGADRLFAAIAEQLADRMGGDG